jgi:predicted CXXCH cytochrome family protein
MLALLFAALGVLGVVGLVGCSAMDKEDKHRMLTFFFTGVPPLEDETAAATPADQSPTIALPTPGGRTPVKRASDSTSGVWVHGPVGANQCDLCHTVSPGTGFSSVSVPGAGVRLQEPKEQLCLGCHPEKGPEAARAQGARLHKPAAAGWCTACHDAHRALRRYQLRGANNRELCSGCHKKSSLSTVTGHTNGGGDCLNCHNAHMGRTKRMLRVNFDESVESYGG